MATERTIELFLKHLSSQLLCGLKMLILNDSRRYHCPPQLKRAAELTVRGGEDDFGAPHLLLRRAPIRNDRLKPTATCSRDVEDNSCSHPESLNCFGRFGNRPRRAAVRVWGLTARHDRANDHTANAYLTMLASTEDTRSSDNGATGRVLVSSFFYCTGREERRARR